MIMIIIITKIKVKMIIMIRQERVEEKQLFEKINRIMPDNNQKQEKVGYS